MRHNDSPRHGIVLVSARWVTLLVGVALSLAVTSLSAGAGDHGTAASEARTGRESVWQALRSRVQALLQPADVDDAQEEVEEALGQLGARSWHEAGHRGKGITVAVLDSGFRGYRRALGQVLPKTVKARSFRKDGRLEARESQHGILCAEVIRHVAPDVEFIFANWEPETPETFLDAVRWACQEGAQILSCSVIMPSWSDGEGGGAIHQELRAALGDRLMFASAGNTAQRHWSGPLEEDADGWHQWGKARSDNAIHPYAEDRVSVELTSRAGGFEMIVIDATRSLEVGRARTELTDGCGNAVIRFEPVANHRYFVRIRATTNDKRRGDSFHLTCLGGKLQYADPRGSIPFPGDGSAVIAVGAVDGRGRRLSYSSCGPSAAGPKPDLVATVPFPSVWRPDQPFSGTSAAAPQAAGLAALLWARHPEWTGSQVREELARIARKIRPEHCHETGHGLVRLQECKR